MLLQTSQRQRGECGTFSGGRKTFRGVCGTFSGVPEDRPKFHLSAFSIQKLQRKTRFQDSTLQYYYGKSSLKAPFPS